MLWNSFKDKEAKESLEKNKMVKTLDKPNAIATGTPIIRNRKSNPNKKRVVIIFLKNILVLVQGTFNLCNSTSKKIPFFQKMVFLHQHFTHIFPLPWQFQQLIFIHPIPFYLANLLIYKSFSYLFYCLL